MLDEQDCAALESLIRRMTDKQRNGLEAWLNGGYLSSGPLWPVVKEAQEYVDWFEVPEGGR
jgi:hypothetical protein